MEEIIFSGRVVPDFIRVNYEAHIRMKIGADDGGPATLIPSIKDSQISVRCEVAEYRAVRISSLYRSAIDIANVVVEMLAFKHSWALSIVLDKVVAPDGRTSPILLHGPFADEGPPLSVSSPERFSRALAIAAKDHRIWRTLNTLIDISRHPHISTLNAGRVVDGIRNLVAPDVIPKEGWQRMREALNVDASYLKYITDLSISPRHGGTEHVSGVHTGEVSRRAWILFDRFLIYRDGRDAPLTAPSCPLLTHTPVV